MLHGVDFTVAEGEVVVILGANGAGKTTTLRALSRHDPRAANSSSPGESLRGLKPERVAQAGIAHVPQGRGTLADLTVEENLRLGAHTRKDKEVGADLDRWFGVFPRLSERRTQAAGSMSGGEQQMLAIARALMSRPRLVLLDEPSLGLAPIITQELFRILGELNRDTGLSMLVVEQNAGARAGYRQPRLRPRSRRHRRLRRGRRSRRERRRPQGLPGDLTWNSSSPRSSTASTPA